MARVGEVVELMATPAAVGLMSPMKVMPLGVSSALPVRSMVKGLALGSSVVIATEARMGPGVDGVQVISMKAMPEGGIVERDGEEAVKSEALSPSKTRVPILRSAMPVLRTRRRRLAVVLMRKEPKSM